MPGYNFLQWLQPKYFIKYYSMKQNAFISKILMTIMLQIGICQTVFSQNFQQYNMGGNAVLYVSFNATWYRSDVAKLTGQYKVKGPTAKVASKYLSVFAENSTSATCVDLNLTIGNIYDVSFDHFWDLLNDFTLIAKWNSLPIFSNTSPYTVNQGQFVHFKQNLPVITATLNTLCFCGTNLNLPGARTGPSVDNIVINLVSVGISLGQNTTSLNKTNNTSIQINSSQINQSNSITNFSNINSSIILIPNTPINSSIQVQKNDQQMAWAQQTLNMHWISNFTSTLGKFITYTSFFGFAYLISNLLNFWNIIVLYYFIPLDTILGIYRIWLQQLCKISLQEGSIVTLIVHFIKKPFPNIPNFGFQKVLPSTTDWASFSQMGFSSQIIQNNIQIFFSFFSCFIKLIILNLFVKLIRKSKNCITPFILGIKVKNARIFCYEVVSSLPTMIVPLGIVTSTLSSCGAINLYEKFNNLALFMVVLLYLVVLLVPILFKQKYSKLVRPQLPKVKSTILVQSHATFENLSSNSISKHFGVNKSLTMATTIKSGSLKIEPSILGNKVSNSQVEHCEFSEVTPKTATVTIKQQELQKYRHRLSTYRKQLRYHDYMDWSLFIQLLDHILFFTIPFLVGLQSLPIFFAANFIILIISLTVFYKKGYLIREFDCKEYLFGISIKAIFVIVHVVYLILYMKQIQAFGFWLGIDIRAGLSFMTLCVIILGALIQTIHSFFNLLKWIYQFIKKVSPEIKKQEKIVIQQPKKLLQHIHLRKDTEQNLNSLTQNKNNKQMRVQMVTFHENRKLDSDMDLTGNMHRKRGTKRISNQSMGRNMTTRKLHKNTRILETFLYDNANKEESEQQDQKQNELNELNSQLQKQIESKLKQGGGEEIQFIESEYEIQNYESQKNGQQIVKFKQKDQE